MKRNKTYGRLYDFGLLKMVKLMPIAIFIMYISLSTTFAGSLYSDQTKLSLNMKNVRVEEVIDKIEKSSEFFFMYNKNLIDVDRRVDIKVEEKSINEVLESVFRNSDISYSIKDRQILLINTRIAGEPSESATQQQKSVSGKVTDGSGASVPGVSVVLKGTTTGTVTDTDGKFSIPKIQSGSVLVFSFIGMKTQEVTVGNKTTVNVVMEETAIGLDEVVAIGYGTQKRKDLTGAFGQVKSEELTKTAVVGLDQALQGKIAGVQVTSNSGEPGGSVSMRIRGVGSINSSNEPLYIVDGVPYGSLNAINVNDIDRIDVLKDAAAASIYGSRASNGVVLVTTKRGTKGLTITFDGSAGVQSVAKKLDMLNGTQFATLAQENLVNAGLPANPAWSNPATVQNNDWQSKVFQTAPMQNYNLSISSGGEKSSTLFSFGYLDQKGIIVASDYQRYTVRLNSDYNITSKLRAGITVNGSFTKKNSVSSASDFSGILNNALSMQPTSPITTDQTGLFGLKADGSVDPTGNTYYGWNGYSFTTRFANINQYPQGLNNPYYTKKFYQSSPNKSQEILASAFAEYEVIKGLKLKSALNITFGRGYSENYQAASPNAITQVGEFRTLSGYSEGWSQSDQVNLVNTLAYAKSIGNHNISAVVGMDAQKYNYRSVNVNTSGVPDDQHSINASENATRVASGYPSQSALLSYFGRVSYDYNGKYLFSGTIRRDGSSNFGPANQYGVFSSASVGWRISQENFMKSFELINDLKLRGSYGTVGNQNIPSFKYLSTYGSDGGTYQYTIGSNQSIVNAIYQNNVGDPNIHWEKSIQTDIGFDLAIMQSKLTLTADYYIKKLSDLLGYFPVPSYTGVYGSSVLKNGFSMENKGLELTLGYKQKIGEVNFSANANFATLDNKITKLTDNQAAYVTQGISLNNHDGGAVTQTAVGGRIGNFLGYLTDGIVQTAAEATASPLGGLSPGDRKYKDVNKDGIINASDKVVLGNGLPKYTFGLNLNAQYKSLDLSVFFNGQAAVQIANMLRASFTDMRYNNSTGIINGYSELMNRWTGPNTSNTMPRNIYTAPISNDWFSDAYIQDGSFVRVSNVQLGYTLNQSLLGKLGISHVRFYVSGQNLFTFTKYTGYDPEVGSNGQNGLQTGADFGRYPLARMVNLGVNVKF
ncbi:MAG: TonB-dependent receptor [Mariniphaga sp.]|nr:TonB-dependent receptor [Mariniphaga sp.]